MTTQESRVLITLRRGAPEDRASLVARWAGEPGQAGAPGQAGPPGSAGPQGPAGARGPAGDVGPQGPAGTGMVWRAAWNAATTYATNDAVSYAGSSWLALNPNTNDPPPSANWSLVAGTGATGPAGPAGAQGPAGPTGPQGPPGAQGATGPQGSQGATGQTGAQGATGPQGPQGAQGGTGPAGVSSHYQTLQVGGVAQPVEPILNLVAGGGVTLTPADDPANTRSSLTIAATAGSGTGTPDVVQLDWTSPSTADLMSNVTLTQNVWTDVTNSSHSFTVDNAADLIEVYVSGCIIAQNNNVGTRVNVDNGAFVRMLGGGNAASSMGVWQNALAGSALITIPRNTLAAGPHTIKVQIGSSGSGTLVYCRPSTVPMSESLSIRVVERKP